VHETFDLGVGSWSRIILISSSVVSRASTTRRMPISRQNLIDRWLSVDICVERWSSESVPASFSSMSMPGSESMIASNPKRSTSPM
jgi:hypothetical protein